MKSVPLPADVPKAHQTANKVFFPYFGQVDLFQWISIPAKIFNTYMLSFLLLDFYFVSVFTVQQRRLDRAITSTKLKDLAVQWLSTLEQPFSFREVDITPPSSPEDTEKSSVVQDIDRLSVHHHTRHLSATSTSSLRSERPGSRNSIRSRQPSPAGSRRDEEKEDKADYRSDRNDEQVVPPSYRRPTRTNTGLLKRGLMRWSSNKGPDSLAPLPIYKPYEPTFQGLYAASNLLTSSTLPSSQPKCLRGLRQPLKLCISIFKAFAALASTPFRPSVLLAIMSHARQLAHARGATYPEVLSLALRNPAYRTLRSKDIVVASRILLTLHPPPPPTRWMMIGVGWATFGACSILVIGTELTIQWNYISGVQQLNTVGQLIPFCLGVGGLLKVVWAAVMEQERREQDRWCYFGRCNAGDRRKAWKEASEEFEKCREAFERANVNDVGVSAEGKAAV
jgi:hypothetical protein